MVSPASIPIDPALLAQDAANADARIIRLALEQRSNTPSSSTDDVSYDFGAPSDLDTPGPPASWDLQNFSSIVDFGKQLKASRLSGLTQNSQAFFDEFCRPHFPEERLAMMMGVLLGIKDTISKMDGVNAENWIPTGDLKMSIDKYSWAAVISPYLMSYRSESIAGAILAAMRELAIPGLPEESDVTRTAKVLSALKVKLTNDRHTLKTIVINSTKPKAKIVNINDVARELVDGTTLPLRQELILRVALLRNKCLQFPGQDYWNRVDGALWSFKDAAGGVSAVFDTMINTIYQEDQAKFGNAASSKNQPIAPRDVAGWVLTIDKHLRKVEPVPYTASEPEAQAPQPKKRKAGDDSETSKQ